MKRMFAGAGRPVDLPTESAAPSAKQYDDRLAKLEYTQQILTELRRLASGIDEPTLVYLIEMAAEHAADREREHRFRNAIAH